MFNFLKRFMGKEKKEHLIDFMPPVRGVLKKDFPLAKFTRFGVGGPAEVFFEPADEADLVFFLSRVSGVPVTVIGSGSNLLIRDGGIPNIVIKLSKSFSGVEVKGERIIAKAATMNVEIAKAALDAGLSGMEFLAGIPGNIGGSTRMNAGAAGSDISTIMESAKMIDSSGHIHQITKDDLIFNYRETTIPNGWIFLEVTLKGIPMEKGIIAEKMNTLKIKRQESQPVNVKTAGSTFKNPEGLFAWKLIEKAGCRGMRIGGAMVSEKHCNFLVNTGNATANDIETLGEEIRRRVLEHSDIDLKWEIRRIGVKKPEQSTFGGR